MTRITRRDFNVLAAAALLAPRAIAQPAPPVTSAPPAQSGAQSIITRAIPSTGERLPAVGLGTAVAYERDDEATRAALTEVIRALAAGGGRLVDTAPSYGAAESVVGGVIAATGLRDKLFLATKLARLDTGELRRGLERLKVDRVDLLQLHNVRDADQSLAPLREWKAQGLCRYVGITSTSQRAYAAVEAVLAREKPDFVQIDYSLDDRDVEARILPLAAEVRAAVLTALPFGRNRLFRAVSGKEVPEWAKGFAGTWGQFFLKFLIADERVTAVIPGTSRAAHMADNVGAMRGRLPDPDERKRMVAFVQAL